MLTAIILASGQSKRMGENKLLLKLNNKFVIEYIIETILNVKFDDIFLITYNEEIADIGNRKKIKTILNENFKNGQSESIKLGVKKSDKKTNYMFFVGDQPMLEKCVIEKIILEHKKNSDKIILPVLSGKRKNPVVFPNCFREELLLLNGDFGGREIIKNNPTKIQEVNFSEENKNSFFDIDKKEDYEFVKQIIKQNY